VRTVTRTPEVMVKVLPSAANSASAVRKHLAYVGRNGEVELKTDDGRQLEDREAAADLTEDWDRDLAECQAGVLPGAVGGQAPLRNGATHRRTAPARPCDRQGGQRAG